MAIVILSTDGSDHANEALASALRVLHPDPADRIIVATVVDEPDVSLVTGTSGFAGGSMSAEEFEEFRMRAAEDGERIVTAARATLDLHPAETQVLWGSAGPALCQLAETIGADLIVMGSRGLGAIRRALLGSVSTHVVHNAPCAVMITREPND